VRILIVAATAAEIDPLVGALRFCADGDARVTRCKRGTRDVDVLTTGVGMVATAAWCSRLLAVEDDYDIALNLGLCGSFDAAIAPGTVVHVVTEPGRWGVALMFLDANSALSGLSGLLGK